jgi:hypothetical protein
LHDSDRLSAPIANVHASEADAEQRVVRFWMLRVMILDIVVEANCTKY